MLLSKSAVLMMIVFLTHNWVILGPRVLDGSSQVSIPVDIPILAEALAASDLGIFVPSKGWSKIDWNGSGDAYGRLAG